MGPVRRNHAQIREAKTEPVDNSDERLNKFETVSLHSENGPTELIDQTTPSALMEPERTPPQQPELRRSTRERRLPSRFNDFVMQ